MTDNTTSSDDDWSLYPYDPNKPAPIVFAVLLFLLGLAQLYQCFFLYRWKKFGATMLWASAVWMAGFICRAISINEVQSIGIFIAQYVLVLMGPPLYAAAEYFILGRLLAYLPYHTPIHPGRVFSTFAILSAVVESLTGSGASQTASADGDAAQLTRGLNLLRAALILQCLIEAFFFSFVVLVEYRCRKAGNFPRNVRVICYILYITSSMMLVRCIVRTIEGFEAAGCSPNPYCGVVGTNEWFLWVFEIANITLFVILLAIFHPGRYLPRSSEIFLDVVDGKTERLGPGFSKANKRPLLMTFVDPFNFEAIILGKGMAINKFWEEQWPAYNRGEAARIEETQKGSV